MLRTLELVSPDRLERGETYLEARIYTSWRVIEVRFPEWSFIR